MSTKELLIKEIEHIPEPVLKEVLDFVRFLRTKTVSEATECYLASESSFAKDWLSPEEDEAWKDL